MSMIERVEAIISEKLMATWSSASPLAEAYIRKLSGVLAREVIEAMREPDQTMLDAGIADGGWGDCEESELNWRWQLMIDAALKGGVE